MHFRLCLDLLFWYLVTVSFLELFCRYAIAAICLSEMFLNGDAGAGFFNACTRLFNAIVAFPDADMNGIEHPWGKNTTVSDP